MKKLNSSTFYILAALGSLAFLLAFFLAVFAPIDSKNFFLKLLPVIAVLVGICIVVLTVTFTKKAYQIFTGSALIIWGVFELLVIQKVIKNTFFEWWPVMGIFAGLLIFVAGIYKYRKIKFGYFIPALTLFLLGIWFSLFSFKIIKVSFKDVALVAGPLFMIMVCILICALFLIQQKTNQFIAPDDGHNSFDDDELNLKKED